MFHAARLPETERREKKSRPHSPRKRQRTAHGCFGGTSVCAGADGFPGAGSDAADGGTAALVVSSAAGAGVPSALPVPAVGEAGAISGVCWLVAGWVVPGGVAPSLPAVMLAGIGRRCIAASAGRGTVVRLCAAIAAIAWGERETG